jgi:ATP-dependent helicase HrpA
VQGAWRTQQRFLARNRELLAEAQELEERARRRDIVVDEQTLFEFYDARVGADVVSGAHFDTWWRQARRDDPELLTFDPAMLVHESAEEVREEDYPDTWREGDLALPLSYEFDPGSESDGVTVDVPVAVLNQVEDAPFSWQVPGLRHDLVVALIRSLPKQLRVSFVPAPNFAREFLAAASPGEEPLLDALERFLRGRTGVVVPREAWDWSKVPGHLRPTFRVLDDRGALVAQGKDLEALKAPLRPAFAEAMSEAASSSGLDVTGQTRWTFGALERTFTQTRAGHEVRGFPALVDEGATVGVQVTASESEQQASHRRGLRRLLLLALPSPVKAVTDRLGNAERLGLAGSPYPSVAALLDDCAAAAVDALVDRHGRVWDEPGFDALAVAARAALVETTAGVVQDVLRVLEAWREVDKLLSGPADLAMLPALSDMKAQVGRLVHRGFVAEVGAAQLRQLPRYLAAVRTRRERLPAALGKDRVLMDQVASLQAAYLHRLDALPPGRPPGDALVRVRWMLEELRVSLWDQGRGTAFPVSATRVRKALEAL